MLRDAFWRRGAAGEEGYDLLARLRGLELPGYSEPDPCSVAHPYYDLTWARRGRTLVLSTDTANDESSYCYTDRTMGTTIEEARDLRSLPAIREIWGRFVGVPNSRPISMCPVCATCPRHRQCAGKHIYVCPTCDFSEVARRTAEETGHVSLVTPRARSESEAAAAWERAARSFEARSPRDLAR